MDGRPALDRRQIREIRQRRVQAKAGVEAASALAESGIDIKSAGFALRKVNNQFLVAREDFDPAIIALNKAMN